jgi:anaerobic selenocysteine-containing dehydrogenase
MVHSSRGRLAPGSPLLRSEVAIVAGLGEALFPGGAGEVPWAELAGDYDLIRDRISRVVPGFADFNAKVRQPDGFQLPHGPRDSRTFATDTGKANFTVNPLEVLRLAPGRLLLQTVRSHDQYNTTIYGMDDRYRGIKHGRRVVFVHPEDLAERGFADGEFVDLVSEWHDGVERRAERFRLVAYPSSSRSTPPRRPPTPPRRSPLSSGSNQSPRPPEPVPGPPRIVTLRNRHQTQPFSLLDRSSQIHFI